MILNVLELYNTRKIIFSVFVHQIDKVFLQEFFESRIKKGLALVNCTKNRLIIKLIKIHRNKFINSTFITKSNIYWVVRKVRAD